MSSLFATAQKHQAQGQWRAAISCYEDILVQDPGNMNALRFIALSYAQSNDMPKAIDYFLRALDLQPNDANLHNNLGNAYKRLQNIDKAIEHYKKALENEAHYAEAHHNLAGIYSTQNDYQHALKHYQQAIQAKPDFIFAHYHLGLLFLQHQKLDAAKIQFANVLSLCPEHVGAQFYTGILLLNDNAIEEAEQAFQNVLRMDNEHVQAMINLGVIALKKNEGQRGVNYFTEALALDNQSIEARNNLAATFIHHDRFENALMHYDVLLQKEPKNIEYLYNSGVAQMALGHLDLATAHFQNLLAEDTNHFAALNNQAAIFIRQGKRKQAIDFLQRALGANPDDKASAFMLRALLGHGKNLSACEDYVKNLFDNYAIHYDQHLQTVLHYSIPQQIHKLLQDLHCAQLPKVLDLGCGTGLSGQILREYSQILIGVDLSTKMIAQAEKKAIYDELHETNIIDYLQKSSERFDLMVAADVLPYFGELHTLFSAVHSHLTAQGLFIFTHEISRHKAIELQETARFCHHPDEIKRHCEEQHLSLIVQEKIKARQQKGQDLSLMLCAAKIHA
jgi:predicted TPR repeat methyltransferase